MNYCPRENFNVIVTSLTLVFILAILTQVCLAGSTLLRGCGCPSMSSLLAQVHMYIIVCKLYFSNIPRTPTKITVFQSFGVGVCPRILNSGCTRHDRSAPFPASLIPRLSFPTKDWDILSQSFKTPSTIWACVAKLKDLGLHCQAQGFGLASPSLRIWACVTKLKDLGLRRQAQGFGLASPSSKIWTCVPKLKDLGSRCQAQGFGVAKLKDLDLRPQAQGFGLTSPSSRIWGRQAQRFGVAKLKVWAYVAWFFLL